MARSTPTLIYAAQQSLNAEQPGYLVQIIMDVYNARLTTLDVDFSYGGYIWFASDITVSSLQWSVGGAEAGKMTLGDPDLQWWDYVLNLKLQDAPVFIWQVYASASEQAEPLWSGRIGGVAKGDMLVECALVNEAGLLRSPRRRVQDVVPRRFLLPSGTIIKIGNNTWKLDRKQNR